MVVATGALGSCVFALTHVSFTRLTIFFAMVSAVFADMRNVVFCAAIGSLTGFHVAGYLDPSAYACMRRRKGWTVPYFYLGHVVLHVVPVIVLLPDPARPSHWNMVARPRCSTWHGI